ncbi:hypothetical protein RMSM_02130 [Rhodopirellula maiorica SM1]|uniref:Uncharacterized protein n=1 Tax=Rhodopirellula maiorica SM1 TaxID=1265738 RepID=M5RZW2_9BACT|nr:hypothetical protein RMSM_02130 [Rhodopirellula maiorica SM1]
MRLKALRRYFDRFWTLLGLNCQPFFLNMTSPAVKISKLGQIHTTNSFS